MHAIYSQIVSGKIYEDGGAWLNGLCRILADLRQHRDKQKPKRQGLGEKRVQESLDLSLVQENLCQMASSGLQKEIMQIEPNDKKDLLSAIRSFYSIHPSLPRLTLTTL